MRSRRPRETPARRRHRVGRVEARHRRRASRRRRRTTRPPSIASTPRWRAASCLRRRGPRSPARSSSRTARPSWSSMPRAVPIAEVRGARRAPTAARGTRVALDLVEDGADRVVLRDGPPRRHEDDALAGRGEAAPAAGWRRPRRAGAGAHRGAACARGASAGRGRRWRSSASPRRRGTARRATPRRAPRPRADVRLARLEARPRQRAPARPCRPRRTSRPRGRARAPARGRARRGRAARPARACPRRPVERPAQVVVGARCVRPAGRRRAPGAELGDEPARSRCASHGVSADEDPHLAGGARQEKLDGGATHAGIRPEFLCR